MKAWQCRLALLGLAAAQIAAAAPVRFVPAEAGYVVADVSRAAPDPGLRELLLAARDRPSAITRVALADAYLERARARREPMFVGRAESLLAPPVTAGTADAAERRRYAWTLQYRHDFDRAARLLDAVLAAAPRDVAARAQRASVRLVRGEFAGARADCAQLVAAGEVLVGLPCLAEAMAGQGDLERGRSLLATFAAPTSAEPRVRAYLLAVRAELDERAGRPDAAIAGYSTALTLAPDEDSIRAALADALRTRGDRPDAATVADIDRPSLALLARQALAAEGEARSRLRQRARELLALERDRADAAHEREAALLALDAGDAAAALTAARVNFERQRELPDVRVLARAAVAARDAAALAELRRWLAETRFADVVTAGILATAERG
ncbi:MAG TPA: hypothetical protein VMF52_18040 [Steroidobacteraceae bacterium]|nr:hypothetical protein [Steroidobacteraceae bacterium]